MKHGEKQRLAILRAGMKTWEDDPMNFSIRSVARQMGISHAVIHYYFDNTETFVNSIAFHAVAIGNSKIIVFLIAMNHHHVKHLTDADRCEHVLEVNG